MKKRLLYLVLGLVIIASLLISSCGPTQKTPVLMAGPPAEWSMYPIMVGLADIANRNTNLEITVRSFSNGLALLQSVVQGMAQVGGGIYDASFAQGYYGTGDWAGKADKNLRTALVIRLTRLGFMAPKKSGIKSIADLKGKKVGWPLDRGSTVWFKPLIEAAGLDPEKDVQWIRLPSGAEIMEQVRMGQIDAFEENFEGADLIELSQSLGPMVPLPVTPQIFAYVQQKYPTPFIGYVLKTMEPGYQSFFDFTTTTPCLATGFVTFSRANISDDIIEEYVTALVNNQAAVKQITADIAEFGPTVISSASAVPYHEGAIKALKKAKLWTDEMEQAHKKALAS